MAQEQTIEPWIKSSFSADETCCVEVQTMNSAIRIRDSKQRRQAPEEIAQILTFTRAEWEAFIQGVKAGEFDL